MTRINPQNALFGTEPSATQAESQGRLFPRVKKSLAMYATMVVVSTGAIFLLEHASLLSAFRTALVAAVGKTLAANWVSGIFD